MAGDFNILQTLVNGNIDLTNLSAAAVQALQASTAPLSSHATIAASESRTNTAYGTLTTPDQVAGLVVPANGLIAVRYQALWQESVAGAARAAIFIGSNQMQIQGHNNTGLGVLTQAAATNSAQTNADTPLFTTAGGLMSVQAVGGATVADVTTGQAMGYATNNSNFTANIPYQELGGNVQVANLMSTGGQCDIFGLPAGTYTVSVQFKASSGSVTASNRHLLVQVLPFG